MKARRRGRFLSLTDRDIELERVEKKGLGPMWSSSSDTFVGSYLILFLDVMLSLSLSTLLLIEIKCQYFHYVGFTSSAIAQFSAIDLI